MPRFRSLFPAILALSLSACGGGGGDDGGGPEPNAGPVATPKSVLSLENFPATSNCQAFRDYAADGLTEQYLRPFYRCLADSFAPCPLYVDGPAEAAAPGAMTSDAAGLPPSRVSGTNTQESGVDEADTVKVDSQGNLYILAGKHLYIVDAFPPAGLAGRPLVTLDVGNSDPTFYALDFFLDEAAQRVVVLGQSYTNVNGTTVNVIVDVSNPAQPAITGRLAVEGYGLEARRIGSRVHRVSRFEVPLPAWFHDSSDPLHQKRIQYLDAQQRGEQAAMASLKAETRTLIGQRVDAAGADSLLPKLFANGTASALDCSAVARPDVSTGLGLVVIDSFNSDGAGRATSGAINNGWMVYASTRNLFVAQSSFGWRFDAQQAEETAIHRFSLSDAGAAAYQGVGKIPGSIGGPYAMSEFGGNLRVASTETRFTSGPGNGSVTTFNHLNVLRADQPGGDMNVVGGVSDFAQGERIQGVRFLGDRGFVVTFRQVDPLFAFDLSNPARPAIRSELKIPGFSSYLAPVGDDFLLTVGREGTDSGQLTGRMQVSLFDVQDLANVQQVDTLVPGNPPTSFHSYSAAEYDPHAFVYFPDTAALPSPGTLALPLQSYGNDPGEQFAGFVVVRVDTSSPGAQLTEIGRVDHSTLGKERFCGGAPEDAICAPAIYAADPRRAVFMLDPTGPIDLYTISLVGLVASNAAEPDQELGRRLLPFDPPPFDYCCVIAGGGGGAVPPGP